MRRGQGGMAVLELVLLAPLFVVLVYVVVGLGRLGLARQDVDAVARDAARAGSLARSAEEAAIAARAAATDALGRHDLTCAELDLDVETASFGPGGWVRVELACRVALDDLAGPWVRGSRVLSAAGQAAVDAYRGTR
ncbi:MAG: TadE/TadG family type IV pilus assembly protein [Acidimicrobiia bacterium]